MISALTELRYRKPQVEDFENIIYDTENWSSFSKGLYRNSLFHLIFLITGVSIGLTIGNLVFLRIIVQYLL